MATLDIGDITVTLNIGSNSDSALTAVLVAPNGTTIPLFSGVGGASGKNFINTVFDDSASSSIATGTAPFTGTFKPEYSLNSATLTSLQGLLADGTWQLKITNSNSTLASTLDSWSLTITPQLSVTPVAATETTINGVTFATAFTIGFPQQQLSGTYTIQLGPGIAGPVRQRDGPHRQRGPRCAPRPEPERPDHHGQLPGCRPAQDHPRGDDRPVRPGCRGLGILEHRRA